MQNWQYSSSTKIVAGSWRDQLKNYPYPGNVLLVTTPGFTRRGLTSALLETIGSDRVQILDEVTPNPDIDQLDSWLDRLRAYGVNSVLALGGGSAIDTAKVMAMFLASGSTHTVSSHFRDGRELPAVKAIPIIAAPTTSGTGAEVTPFATVWDLANARKYSLASELVRPVIALLDPLLTQGSPAEVTISSGLDAVSHAFESIWNRHSSPLTILFATKALALAFSALPLLSVNPTDLEARAHMQLASTLAGMSISSTRTALAHAMSYPLTSHFDLPHGLACSFTLPALLRFNANVDDGRLCQLSIDLGCADVEELSNRLEQMILSLGTADLLRRYLPADSAAVLALRDQMFTPGRADNNLRSANVGDVSKILHQSLSSLGLV